MDFARFFEEYENMKKENVRPDEYTYSALMYYYSNKNDDKRILEMLEEMKEIGLNPNLITYSFVLRSYTRNNQLENAENVFAYMRSNLSELATPQLPLICYSLMMQSFMKVNNLTKVEYYFNLIIADGLRPNKLAYSYLIKIYLQHRKKDAVIASVTRMNDEKIVLDRDTFLSLLKDFINGNHFDEIRTCFKGLVASGFNPDSSFNENVNSIVSQFPRAKAQLGFIVQ